MLFMQETYFKDKSGIKWRAQGDRNTSFFHLTAKIRMTTNLITFSLRGNDTLGDKGEIVDNVEVL